MRKVQAPKVNSGFMRLTIFGVTGVVIASKAKQSRAKPLTLLRDRHGGEAASR
jgi:hypothetical protein